MIKLTNLSYAYNDMSKQSLKNIDLEINKGEVIALIGKSGCGKTTLTRVINGLAFKFYEGIIEGEIIINNKNICDMELYEIGQSVGSIFQNPKSQFFAEYVEDEIAFGLENYGVDPSLITDLTNDALTSINGAGLHSNNLFRLSSGQRQKVAIASINALDPPIYVFDEPSSNLDMESVEALKDLMLDLKNKNKTIIISEHRIYYLMDIVDKFYYIKDGCITNMYTPNELKEKEGIGIKELGIRSTSLNNIKANSIVLEGENSLLINNLSFSYKGNDIIHNLNYQFYSGNTYGIIGSNGIGKSTLAKLISGLLKEKSGKVYYNEKKLSRAKRRKLIYYLSNNPDSNLFEVSCKEELALSDSDVDIENVLMHYNLESCNDVHPQILSGGQKQRLTIATGELLDRDVYIFDEPTSGLDSLNMHMVSDRIKELQKLDKIIIVISHDYEFLMECCNEMLHFKDNQFIKIPFNKNGEKVLKILKGEVNCNV